MSYAEYIQSLAELKMVEVKHTRRGYVATCPHCTSCGYGSMEGRAVAQLFDFVERNRRVQCKKCLMKFIL